ncbi:MAG: hypothetical protein V1934_00385 [Methanobacteriota archaeon]
MPLEVDILPYGFLNKYQSFRYNRHSPEVMAAKIIKIIMGSNIKGIKSNMINMFSESPSFDKAKCRAKMLKKFNNFTRDEINYIIESSIKNDQIYNSFGARDVLLEFLKTYEGQIVEKNIDKLKDIFSKNPISG